MAGHRSRRWGTLRRGRRVGLRFRESADSFTWSDWTDEPPASQRYLQVELTLAPGTKFHFAINDKPATEMM